MQFPCFLIFVFTYVFLFSRHGLVQASLQEPKACRKCDYNLSECERWWSILFVVCKFPFFVLCADNVQNQPIDFLSANSLFLFCALTMCRTSRLIFGAGRILNILLPDAGPRCCGRSAVRARMQCATAGATTYCSARGRDAVACAETARGRVSEHVVPQDAFIVAAGPDRPGARGLSGSPDADDALLARQAAAAGASLVRTKPSLRNAMYGFKQWGPPNSFGGRLTPDTSRLLIRFSLRISNPIR